MPQPAAAPPGAAEASDVFDLVLAGERLLLDGVFAAAEVGVRAGSVARIA
jgi:hypothetical protein